MRSRACVRTHAHAVSPGSPATSERSPATSERSVPSPNVRAVSDFGPDVIAVVPLLPLWSFYCFMRNGSDRCVCPLWHISLDLSCQDQQTVRHGRSSGDTVVPSPCGAAAEAVLDLGTSSRSPRSCFSSRSAPVTSSELCPGPRVQSCCCGSSSLPTGL